MEVNAMSNLVSHVEAIKSEVEKLAKEVEGEKLIAVQAAQDLVSQSASVARHPMTRTGNQR